MFAIRIMRFHRRSGDKFILRIVRRTSRPDMPSMELFPAAVFHQGDFYAIFTDHTLGIPKSE